MKKVLAFSAGLLLSSATLFAQAPSEGFQYHGYARGGVSGNAEGNATNGSNQFTVDGGYTQARFGNESNYSEHALSYTGVGDDIWWTMTTRVAFDFPDFSAGWDNLSADGYGIILPEAYLRAGFNDGSASIWVGNRYNDSIGLDLYDYYINDLSTSYGIGIDNLPINEKLSFDFAYLLNSGGKDVNTKTVTSESSGNNTEAINDERYALHTFNIKPTLELGPGALSVMVAPTIATSETGNKPGALTEARYIMNNFLGLLPGSFDLFAFYDFGSGVSNTGYNTSDISAYRAGGGFQSNGEITDKLTFKLASFVEAKSGTEYSSGDDPNGVYYTLAARPFYAFTDLFGLMFEYDFDLFNSVRTGVDTSTLHRVTLAPTLTLDSNGSVFSNPIIQAYVSYAYGDFNNDSVAIDGLDDQGFKYGVSFTVGW